MKLKKVLSICKTNGLYYLYDRIDRSGEITQWLGDACALYPLDVRAKEHIFLNQTPEDVLICSVQCLPEPGECVSRLITAKSSFPEPPLERFWKTEGNLADRKKREEAPVLYVEEKEGVTSICYEGRRYKIPTGQICLLGQHNYFDIGMAYAVCSLLGSIIYKYL